MTPTNVGMRCPECAKQRTKVVRMREMARVPRVTYGLVAINVLVFLTEKEQFTLSGGAGGTVVNEGFLSRYVISGLHQYWRLVSNAFIHEDIIHIGFNMYLLYVMGLMLEPTIGSLRFGVIYATSLLTGSFGILLWSSGGSIGASGAVFGVIGAAAVEVRSRGLSLRDTGIAGLILINLLFTFLVPNISIGAHVGGLIGGVLAGFAFKAAEQRRMPALGFAACLLLSAAAVVGSLAVAGSSSGFA